MSGDAEFMDHWVDIEPERMERYETMFQWNPASEVLYEPAQLREGQVIADFGCGPGHAAIEFARKAGVGGHVHALDVNAEFVAKAKARADEAGLGDRITVHLLKDSRLPLDSETLDRVIARNTIIYVQDPVFTLSEFRRALRPGGIAHAIEGDWSLTAVEPIPTAEWREVIKAASWAWPRPEIGRGLYGFARAAGFDDLSVRVMTIPDTDGRLFGMIKSVTEYAGKNGEISPGRLDAMLRRIEKAITEERYLAIAPQFLVTAVA